MAKQLVIVRLWYDGVWNTHTTDVLPGVAEGGQDITITRGQSDEASQPSPANATLTFKSHTFNPRNPSSSLYGKIGRNTPIMIDFAANTDIRFIGEVSSWKPKQSLGGPNSTPVRWVEAEAAGITRRLEQGADPLDDTVRRLVDQNRSACLGYWPLDDPQGQRRARSGISGGQSMKQHVALLSAEFGTGNVAPWFAPCLSTGQTNAGQLTGPLIGAISGGYVADFIVRSADPATWGADEPQVLFVTVKDTQKIQARVWIDANTDVVEVQVIDSTGATLGSDTGSIGSLLDGQPHHIRFRISDPGGTFGRYTVFVDGENTATASVDVDIGLATLPAPSSVQIGWEIIGANVLPWSVQHLVAWNSALVVTDAQAVAAYFGHQGETAGDRISRLCDEQGVEFLTYSGSTLADSIPMGPQYPDGFMVLVRECADADRGLVIDGQTLIGDQLGLVYRPHRHLYNQDPALELDYDAAEVAPPLEPVVDDQGTRNDVTVTGRVEGEARAVDETGPLGVDTIGRTTDSATVNVLHESMLGDQAGWRLHLGTIDETRFPKITIDLDASPGLAAPVADLDLGDRITIDNLPASFTPDLANLLVLGWTETIGSHRRKITLNCVPASAYQIGEVEHTDFGVLGSGSATLAEALTTTETDVTINCGGGPEWVHEADFDIAIAGERMTVTAVGAASGTFPARLQTLTVARSVNGVVKTHDGTTNDEITFFHKSYVGL